jgi:hypothetical protein
LEGLDEGLVTGEFSFSFLPFIPWGLCFMLVVAVAASFLRSWKM